MLLSKKAEMYLPVGWPAYFSRTAGVSVWDLRGREFIDVSMMGIGTNILGYSYPAVDAAVHATVERGNLSTLNAPEEVFLAEKLIELHPWADMVRFARSGGEVGAIAIRIARAASGKDKVAFCGYHGWHDWYLSANLNEDDSLDGHLLPGLEPHGVPRALAGTAVPFTFNNLDQLRAVMAEGDVGVIYMEVQRSTPPAPGFLEGVRELADQYNAVLVFDECTSGFRRTLGGIHQVYGVEPDMATFGKTLGNGYAITAVIGRRDVMEAAQTSFISSTFWTERIGPSAALATLEAMEQTGAPARIHEIGSTVQQTWAELGTAHGLGITTGGLPALANFTVEGLDPLLVKTYVTTRMLEHNYLGSTSFYASIAHTPEILDPYFTVLDVVFAELASMDNTDLAQHLPYGPAQSGFARLT